MTIDKKENGSCTELYLKGWLETQTAPMLGEAVAALNPDTESLVLDLTDLEYISSAGIRQIVAAHKQMKGQLILRHASPEVLDVLKLTGLDKKLTIEE